MIRMHGHDLNPSDYQLFGSHKLNLSGKMLLRGCCKSAKLTPLSWQDIFLEMKFYLKSVSRASKFHVAFKWFLVFILVSSQKCAPPTSVRILKECTLGYLPLLIALIHNLSCSLLWISFYCTDQILYLPMLPILTAVSQFWTLALL